MPTNTEVYQQVTDKIVAAIEQQGVTPWRKPWRPALDTDPSLHRALARPTKAYRGINQFICWATAIIEGYSSPYWLSRKDIKARGGSWSGPGTQIIWWSLIPKKTDEIDPKTGKPKVVKIPVMKTYWVWNLDQCSGIEAPEAREEDQHFDSIMEAELVIENMPNAPTIQHGGNGASYFWQLDLVRLPRPEQFITPEAYYLTAFHELGHSTGHKDRLNREHGQSFGDEKYSKEELIAEMTAAMLGAVVGLEDDFEPTAEYLRGWLKALGEDPKLMLQAAQAAQKAADCILGTTFEEKPETAEMAVAA